MIRPIDLQSTIINATQNAAGTQRSDADARAESQATQAAFSAELTHREAVVAPTGEVLGNRVGARDEKPKKRKQPNAEHEPGTAFEDVVDEISSSVDDAPHLVDFTA